MSSKEETILTEIKNIEEEQWLIENKITNLKSLIALYVEKSKPQKKT